MTATSAMTVMEWRRERLRAGPWRGSAEIAYLSPLPGGALPSAGFVWRSLQTLADQGFRRVVTGALSPQEQVAFRSAGFEVTENLHLLSYDLRFLPPGTQAPASLRRGSRRDRPTVLELDHLAFEPFWQLDQVGFEEAISATPHARFRVATDPPGDAVVAYAITGRAGRRGYIQRLAVHPLHQRQGLGLLLVVDALRWLRRWRADRALVNTQLANDRALALYERAGFKREPSGLSVLARDLDV